MKRGETFFTLFAFIAGITIGAACNCSSKPRESFEEKRHRVKDAKVQEEIHEIELSDGTRCVVFWTGASYQGDIECNWPDNPTPGEKKQ